MSILDDCSLSLVLEYAGDPDNAQLPELQGAGEMVAGRIWQQIRDRPKSQIGIMANALDALPLSRSAEKLSRLAEQVGKEFAYRSQLGWATWARDKVYDPKWADKVDAELRRLDLEEAEQVLESMATVLWGGEPMRPVEEAFPPEQVQDRLQKMGIAGEVSVQDVHEFLGFLAQWNPHMAPRNRLNASDMAYLKTPKIKLLVSAYFRDHVRGMRYLKRFPSTFIRDYRPEKLLIEGGNCSFPLRLPPNCLRVLHLRNFYSLRLPERAFDGMDTLEELYLDGNGMKSFPYLGRLPNLLKFSAKDQDVVGITQLPQSLGDLPKLKEIYLGGNDFQTVPASFFDSLPSLEVVDMRDNPLLTRERIPVPHRVDLLRDGLPNMPGRGPIVQTTRALIKTSLSALNGFVNGLFAFADRVFYFEPL